MAILLSSGNYFGEERKHDENAGIKLNITRYDPFTDIREHYHENAYLSLLIRGQYRECTGGGEKDMRPGEVIFRPAGYRHANLFPGNGGSCLNVEFKPEVLYAHTGKAVFPERATVYPAGAFEYLYRLLYCFINDMGAGLTDDYILTWMGAQAAYKIPERLLWLPRVKAILETELETLHSITALAARVHVHPVYLARAFKEREGLTPGEYHLKMRLKRVVELLFRTDESISSIAWSTGFTDAAHLIRCFRASYHVTPHRFRSSLKS